MNNQYIKGQEEINDLNLATDTAVRSMNYPKASAVKKNNKNNRKESLLSPLLSSMSKLIKLIKQFSGRRNKRVR